MAELNFKSTKRKSLGRGRASKVALRLVLGGFVLAGILIRLDIGA